MSKLLLIIVASAAFVLSSPPAAWSETPLPAALPLFATGLGVLGLLAWRRKRKAQAEEIRKIILRLQFLTSLT